MKVSQKPAGKVNGQTLYEYKFNNDNGLEITCLNFGCIITKILAPDKDQNYENIVLGFENAEDYESNDPYFGAVVGRGAGRIKNAEFELEGKKYQLAKNNDGNHLHGGFKGFSHVIWESTITENEEEVGIQFCYISPDGEEGYPGTVDIQVTYTLNNHNELLISYKARTDKTTLLNLTNHTYFNLSGDLKRDISQHELKIDSNRFLELNEQLLPTGELLDVTGTVFDFRESRKIQDGLLSNHFQNELVGNGYDHPFLLNSNHHSEIILRDEDSGRKVVIETDEPAVVLYSGNYLPDGININGGKLRKYLGLALETQGPPDAIHHSHFPSSIVKNDQLFSSKTKYTFGVE